MCTKQVQYREKGIQPPVSHTLSDYHICHGVRPLGTMSRIEVFLHQARIACQWIALLKCPTILTKFQ